MRQCIIDSQTDPWAMKVSAVKIMDVADYAKRAMTKQPGGEPERRAKIVNGTHQDQAAEKMVQAMQRIARQPIVLQPPYRWQAVENGLSPETGLAHP